jgi:hypothetical protein
MPAAHLRLGTGGDVGVTDKPRYLEIGYRIEEIATGGERGWYYGRADARGELTEKVGPFESHADALKHLEEELFADDED